MNSSYSISDLDIIGYFSLLEKKVLPRILPPVYQVRQEPNIVLLPPFTQLGDEIFGMTVSSLPEFDDYVRKEEATRLQNSIPGQIHHELWVDDHRRVAYESRIAVRRGFNEIFGRHLQAARAALRQKNWDAAWDHAAVARAVNPNHIDPLVIRAAAESCSGECDAAAFTKTMAADLLAPAEFEKLVERCLPSVPKPGFLAGIAALRPINFLPAPAFA